MRDLISRKALCEFVINTIDGTVTANDIMRFPVAELDNQVHLCGFCKYGYPECPAELSDIIFGKGIGYDNVCACAKFAIKPEQTAKVENIQTDWYDDEYINDRMGDMYQYGDCGNCGQTVEQGQKYCPECGVRLEWNE